MPYAAIAPELGELLLSEIAASESGPKRDGEIRRFLDHESKVSLIAEESDPILKNGGSLEKPG